jgi:uncharacterized membrane-anchored protein
MAMLGLWYWSLGSISMDSVSAREVEAFYCAANLLAKMGTVLGDWVADAGARL